MLITVKIAKKIAFLRSLLLNFAIAIIPRSFDQMAIADRDLDLDREKKIAIDDQKIADHSCLNSYRLLKSIFIFLLLGFNYF